MQNQHPNQITANNASLELVREQLIDSFSSSLKALNIVSASKGGVVFAAEFYPVSRTEMKSIESKIETSVLELQGVENVSIVSTALAAKNSEHPNLTPKMIAVGSGKGGVGKSTLSVNLALALARTGIRVGILDADIYGPSVPKMLGIEGNKVEYEASKLKPSIKSGLRVMSMGLMVAPEQAVMWRGPMLIQALKKMINETDWGDTQIIVIDLPPGTGDVQMSLAKNSDLYGAVVVSTPQDVAMADARKAISMFERLDIPLLGVVENMVGFSCPKCGEISDIFGRGGVRDEAERNSYPFLGQIPLITSLRKNGDEGYSSEQQDADNNTSNMFDGIARNLLRQVLMETKADE